MSQRKNVMLGTAGHVDHGKTALVKLLTGCDTDRLAVEKQRGLTIELGFAPCQMNDERIVGIVDVPGHHGFIRNMAAGAHGVDVVILVVAADDGVMPQTREHLDILTLMGVEVGVVALTKIDLVDEEMRELVSEDLRETLRGTFLEKAAICPLSNITGEGFDGFLQAMNTAVDQAPERETSGLFRLWVERSFPIKGFGTVVSGIPTSGEATLGERLYIAGDTRRARVRRLEVYGEDAEVGRAGECVAMNLLDADAEVLPRGSLLCGGENCPAVEMFEAELRLLARATSELKDYADVRVHVGTTEASAHVALLEGAPIEPGESALVQMRLERALPVVPGERFIIRASLPGAAGGQVTTIGGGVVLGACERKLKRRRAPVLAALAKRRGALGDREAWTELHLQEAGACCTSAELTKQLLLPAAHVQAALAALVASGSVVALDAGFVHAEFVAALAQRVVEAVAEDHRQRPDRAGVVAADVQASLQAERAVFDYVLERLVAEARLVRRGPALALPTHQPQVSEEDQSLRGALGAMLHKAGLTPPTTKEAAEALGVDQASLDRVAALLLDQGEAIRLDERLVMHQDAVEQAKQAALELFRVASGFTTAEFRDHLGVSRKYVVPLLDHLDTLRWTTRTANRRTPGRACRATLEGPAE
jgi:selenocysteine-specific elongation factor